jgi:hypothetical protein
MIDFRDNFIILERSMSNTVDFSNQCEVLALSGSPFMTFDYDKFVPKILMEVIQLHWNVL